MKPAFKGKEIVIKKEDKGLDMGGSKKEAVGVVEYIGEEQMKYAVGDKILYNEEAPKKDIEFFGETLRILQHDGLVICKILE